MTRILFVDDEPNLLEGLKRMLRPRREQWELAFAPGGEAALAELAAKPFDVIVSDIRMPGMDGTTLLTEVRDRFPNVVRIALSGHTELESALRTLPVAHQFLTKPCPADTLQDVVERAAGLQALLTDETLRRTVGEMKTLPSLPRVYAALTQLLARDEASLGDVVKIVEQDVAIYAKVLQIVNSPFFGLARRVTNIQQAVSILGTTMLRNLALSVEVFHAFPADQRVRGFSLEALQNHVLLVARIATRLLTDKRQAADAFMAAMLHDVGQLILASRLPEQFARTLAMAREAGRPVHAAEAEVSRITHAEIGAYLLGLWGLPFPMVEAVAYHHAPAAVSQRGFDILAAVHVADSLAHEQAGAPGPATQLDLVYLDALGVADRLPAWREMAAEQASGGTKA